MAIVPSKARPAAPWAARRAGDDYGVRDEPDWRSIDWREHLRQTTIEGSRVNYVDIGSGDGVPVVFVHGLAGNWQNWLENVPRVARERRVVALDLPGFGESEPPAGEITMFGYGRVVDALCEELGLGRAVLVGNSMGGFISAEVAIRFPDRVDRLVLVSAVGITTNDVRRAPVMAWGRIAAAAASRSAAERRAALLRRRLRHFAYSMIVRHPSRVPTDILYEISQGAGRSAFLPALKAIHDYDFRARVPEIAAPTLVVWGEDDMLAPVKDAAEYERLVPRARKIVMKDTGHVSMLERPKTFNDALLGFLDEPAAVGEPAAAAAT